MRTIQSIDSGQNREVRMVSILKEVKKPYVDLNENIQKSSLPVLFEKTHGRVQTLFDFTGFTGFRMLIFDEKMKFVTAKQIFSNSHLNVGEAAVSQMLIREPYVLMIPRNSNLKLDEIHSFRMFERISDDYSVFYLVLKYGNEDKLKSRSVINKPQMTGVGFYQMYQKRLQNECDQELISCFNKEVGCKAWVSPRASYLAAIHSEFDRREFDYSAIGNRGSLSLKFKVRLWGNKLIITEEVKMPD